jgi:hypothetical protein
MTAVTSPEANDKMLLEENGMLAAVTMTAVSMISATPIV